MRLVPVKYLRENSYIAIDIIDSNGRLMLKAGQKITTGGIQTLNRLGVAYVYISDEYCFNNHPNKYTTKIDNLYQSIIDLENIANRVIEGISNNTDLENVINISTQFVEDILLDKEDFKISYEPTKLIINSIIEQTIYVAIMSVVLGTKMNLNKKELINLCLATLLKDIALVSPKINMSNDSLYKKHPIFAYDYLKKYYSLDEKILEAILHHHERFDGSGYPNKAKGEDINDFARIISIIDSFYELKSNHEILNNSEKLFEAKLKLVLKTFDTKTLSYFLKNSEIFTLDTMARLTNDDIGIVIENNTLNPFRPIIKVIRSYNKLEGETINLQENSQLSIKNIEYYIED